MKKKQWKVGDYVKVRDDLCVGETYGKVVCQDQDILLGETAQITQIIGDVYKLNGQEFLIFSKEMLEEATGDEIAGKENVAVIEIQAPEIEPEVKQTPTNIMPFTSENLDIEGFLGAIKDFVATHRKSFKNETLFWQFFYDKLATELKLRLK